MKRFIKTFIAAVLAAVLVLCIMGCSGSGLNPTFSDKAPKTQVEEN